MTSSALSVSLHDVEFQENDPSQEREIAPGRYLRLEITDTGSGMDEETIKYIFEPYFTTKGVGEGTGLGLSVVHGIVQSHEGQIVVKSKLGVGTTFSIYLPVCDRDHEEYQSTDQQQTPLKGSEKIMFVDDDEKLLNVAEVILPRYGYSVTTFSNGVQALQEFKKSPGKYDVLITDASMPYMDGVELARQIQALQPQLPIIICSAYSELINKEKAAMGVEFIQKPIAMGQVSNLIRAMFSKENK